MGKNVTAALLSGLVFPGVGQWSQRRRGMALLFFVPAAVAAYFYFGQALDAATGAADQILKGADPAAVMAQVEGREAPLSMTIAGVAFLLCWAGSVIEAFTRRMPPDKR